MKARCTTQDARTIDAGELPDFGLLLGVPLPDFLSLARQGFDDTRGTMFFEIARIPRYKKPPYLLLENVPGLLSHDKGKTFSVILDTLCELGYSVEWVVYNSKDFGVPNPAAECSLSDILILDAPEKYYLTEKQTQRLLYGSGTGRKQGYTVYDPQGLACTQTANTGGLGKGCGLYLVGLQPQGGRHRGTHRGPHPAGRGFPGPQPQSDPECPFLWICFAAGRSPGRQRPAVYHRPTMARHRCPTAKVNFQASLKQTPGQDDPLLIKEATKRGYKEAYDGDSVYLGFPGTNKRRARVGTAFAHTLDTGRGFPKVVVLKGRIRQLVSRECLPLAGLPRRI
ncbi:MAG: DNA (cytosine-5-)-methyltransferase [Bacteroides fragilis]